MMPSTIQIIYRFSQGATRSIIAHMIYYLFRHGETYQTKYDLAYGDEVLSARVLPEGKGAIQKMAKYLKDVKSDTNISSEVLRCRETVEIVSEISGKSFSYDGRLNEFVEDDFELLAKRVKDFVESITKSGKESALICTHGGVMAGIKHFVIEGKFELPDLHDYPRPGVLEIIDGKKVKKINFRDDNS
jgi:broad specificity phosphatase PhoE